MEGSAAADLPVGSGAALKAAPNPLADQKDGLAHPGGPTADTVASKGYRARLLFTLTLISALNLADRQGIAAVAPALKADLRLSDTELGLIQGLGFALFITIFGWPLARLADRSNRTRMLAISGAAFALFLALCSQARSFSTLLLFRIGVGAGEGGLGSPATSLIGDHYPPNKRASAITLKWIGSPIGAFLGAVLGGWVAQNLNWRWWFIGMAVPAALVAILAFFTLREPRRGTFDPPGVADRRPPSTKEVFFFLIGKRSMMHVMVGAGLASLALNGIGQFWGRFFVSAFDIGVAQAGQMLGIISVCSMTIGLMLGGYGVEKLSKRSRRWNVLVPAIGLLLTTPFMLIGIHSDSASAAMWPMLAAHAALFLYFAPSHALVQNMVDSSMRASAAFLLSIVMGLIGVGLGPAIVGVMSDLLASQAFELGNYRQLCPGGIASPGAVEALITACRDASRIGITQSVALTSLLFAWGGIHYLLAARHVEADLDRHYQPA